MWLSSFRPPDYFLCDGLSSNFKYRCWKQLPDGYSDAQTSLMSQTNLWSDIRLLSDLSLSSKFPVFLGKLNDEYARSSALTSAPWWGSGQLRWSVVRSWGCGFDSTSFAVNGFTRTKISLSKPPSQLLLPDRPGRAWAWTRISQTGASHHNRHAKCTLALACKSQRNYLATSCK